MRIESIGLPGSGKSTLIRATMTALNDAGHKAIDPNGLDEINLKVGKGLPVLRRTERTRQAIYFAQFMQKHTDLFNHYQSFYSEALRNMTLLSAVGADLVKCEENQKHFDSFWADEGFLHILAHGILLASDWQVEVALEKLPSILALVPDPTLTIYTHLSAEDATVSLMRRMEGSGRSPKEIQKRFSESFGGEKGMDARAQLLDAIANGLEARGARVFRIKGQKNLPKMVFDTICEIAPDLEVG